MIDDLDEALRQLLLRELPKEWSVNVAFDQPRREWSARLNSKPTLNLFLHDLRENNTLRQTEWQIKRNGDGTATKQRTPVRIDLHYMITAWAAEAEDEHRLLTGALMALFRYPTLPKDVLPKSLSNQPWPIPVRVAEQDALRSPADIWSAMDNELRPAIACILTVAFNPYQTLTGPVVKSRDLRFRQAKQDQLADQFWMVGGTVRGADSFEHMHLTLLERGLEVPVAPNGDFIIGNLNRGDYTLEVSLEGQAPQRRKITVPSPTYDIELEGGGAKKVQGS